MVIAEKPIVSSAPKGRRRKKNRAAQVKLPVAVAELPEYKDAVAWAVDVPREG